ncbi:hypothetical protein GP486_006905 [Trichoglossum hirsutum]|uniref:AAA+ ATPase domain-containing protein n=1 Tax=Trichoglossum hirsutum TaxID=265104 RepID=A0A9P8L586_9PEZI|nr:hypothetical protein GP486_006905 [Trichoglossum hirsutum]
MFGGGPSRRGRRLPPPPPIFDSYPRAGPGPTTEEREQQFSASNRGTKCELKQLDGRYDGQGNYIVADSSVSMLSDDADAEPHSEYALVSTRVYGPDGLYQSTQLEVKSRLIKKALRKVIKFYPGQPVDTSEVVFNDPPKPLFHYRKELDDYKHAKADDETKKHLDLLFKFVDSLIGAQVERFKDLTKLGLISFPLVWMLFKPGDIVFTEKDGHPQAFMISQIEPTRSFIGKAWQLTCVGTGYDGVNFGKVFEFLKINQFEGTREITTLKVYPLKYHPQESKIRHQLLERGKRFLELRGRQHMSYKGMAHILTSRYKHGFEVDDSGMEGERIFQSSLVSGRVMIDCETFCRVNSGNRIRFDGPAVPYNVQLQVHDGPTSGGSHEAEGGVHAAVTVTTDVESKSKRPVLPTLSEKDILLCPPFVLGFSLLNKKWCRFIIDCVEEVELNADAFNQLIIADGHKELIQAMVESHVEGDDSFDDIIQGKGKSLIFLLHGAPGVGKTLTAESIADYTKRPLYMVSSGELGTDPVEVEEKLTHVLDIATTWKAIVLLDEADVFLQQRSGSDVKRNALVSIFLRLLEYYEGILFLTSNRVESFDLAFKSRIHVALSYPELTLPVRHRLWRDFLLRIPEDMRNIDLERDLPTLEKEEINGRQIKNACKTATALARRRGEKLGISHLETTLATIKEFEKDFSEAANHLQRISE